MDFKKLNRVKAETKPKHTVSLEVSNVNLADKVVRKSRSASKRNTSASKPVNLDDKAVRKSRSPSKRNTSASKPAKAVLAKRPRITQAILTEELSESTEKVNMHQDDELNMA